MRVQLGSCMLVLIGLAAGCEDASGPEAGAPGLMGAGSGAGQGGQSPAPQAGHGALAEAGTSAGRTGNGAAGMIGGAPAIASSAGRSAGAPSAGAGSTGGAPADDAGWETIIAAEWELGPGEERYFCQRVTLKEDLYFSAVKALNPLGTHHTALTAAASATRPDGLVECNSSGLAAQGIFGSGVGTDPVAYPEGVGLRLRAGQQLLLNLHVYNVTAEVLRGTSGTAVRRVEPSRIQHVAESLLAGPARFTLPTGRSSVTGKCSMSHDVTLFAVQPHMHQTGVHMRGVAHSSTAGTVMLHDGDYDFENQLVYTIDPVPMKQGDTIDIECTFDNRTDGPISFGESSDQEMCFLVIHRYPAADRPAISCMF